LFSLLLLFAVLQEGDSWTVAFREAEDAVAFSLQVMPGYNLFLLLGACK
jgi:hypothetical protein